MSYALTGFLEGHRIVRKIDGHGLSAKDCRGFAFIGTLDYGKHLHRVHYIRDLVVFHEFARLVNCLFLAPESFFVHEFEGQYDVSLWIDAKHVHYHFAPFNLILRHVEYVTCPRLGFNSQQDAIAIVNGHDVRQPSAASAQSTRMPKPAV